MYLSSVDVSEVPVGPVTVTSTVVPDGLAAPMCGGAVTVISVSPTIVTLVAAAAPKVTPVAPVNALPDTMTRFPPVAGPPAGLTPATVGVTIRRGSCTGGGKCSTGNCA